MTHLKYIFISVIMIIVVIIFCTLKQTELDKFCKPNSAFKNIYNLSEREFLSLNIANKISSQMQYKGDVFKNTSIEELLVKRTGQCDDYSLLLNQCLKLYNFDSKIITVPFNEINGHHSFVIIRIDNKVRALDSTLDDESMHQLFYNDRIIFNYWQINRIALLDVEDLHKLKMSGFAENIGNKKNEK